MVHLPCVMGTLPLWWDLSGSISSLTKWEALLYLTRLFWGLNHELYSRWQEFVHNGHPMWPQLLSLLTTFFFFFFLVPVWPSLALWHLLAWSFISWQWHILWPSEQVSRYPLLVLAFESVSRTESQRTRVQKHDSVLRSNLKLLNWESLLGLHSTAVALGGKWTR